MKEFIAVDFCGWNESITRYTHVPSGETLLETKKAWATKRIEFLKKYPGIPVHVCPGRYTTEGTRCLGSTEEWAEKVRIAEGD